jgi:argininosuccinate lyase
MKKLWQKDKEKLITEIEAFETKGDLLLDQQLIPFDIQGSMAHAKMLCKIGILTAKELQILLEGLEKINSLYKQDKFLLSFGDEDTHSKIENFLTENYGEVGKKIHTGRSRNDQVLTALRLYSVYELGQIKSQTTKLINTFKLFKKEYGKIPMPGYTHMQKAMPSSISLWAESFIAAFKDDLKNINNVHGLINQSPLGSAAGYGVPINLDKKYTASLLGFKKVQENPIYCQSSRGKFDANILSALIQLLLTINKFASDLLLFTTAEFGFFQASESITTGSSIMPQKKNLDLAELLRSKVHLVLGNYVQIVSLSSNLISGYNRDLQDGKKPLMESLEITKESLGMVQLLLSNIKPNKEALKKNMTMDLFATEKTLKLVLKGESFRNAYRKIGKELEGGEKNEKEK